MITTAIVMDSAAPVKLLPSFCSLVLAVEALGPEVLESCWAPTVMFGHEAF